MEIFKKALKIISRITPPPPHPPTPQVPSLNKDQLMANLDSSPATAFPLFLIIKQIPDKSLHPSTFHYVSLKDDSSSI